MIAAQLLLSILVLGNDYLADPSFEDGITVDSRSALSGAWSADEGATLEISHQHTASGDASLKLTLTGSPVMVSQSLSISEPSGRHLRLRGAIRSESLVGQAVLFAMVEGGGKRLFADDMRQRAVSGTTDWTYFDIQIPPLPNAERLRVGVLALGSGIAWFDDLSLVPLAQTGEMSKVARDYLSEALDIMEARALRRENVDWEALRTDVANAASGAKTPADTHGAIHYALTLLGDSHSSFLPATEGHDPSMNMPSGFLESRLLSGQLGYVEIDGFKGAADSTEARKYADAIRESLAQLANADACGWILDFRANGGGNMWPTLAGLGPLLDEETVGSCNGLQGERAAWWVRGNVAGAGVRARASADSAQHIGPARDLPIAVLTSSETASAGEALVITFAGQRNVRIFGEQTAGFATGNGSVGLSDGSTLILTLCEMRDRNGRSYPAGVAPHDPTPAAAALDTASKWLIDSPSCGQ